jgi:putative transposase
MSHSELALWRFSLIAPLLHLPPGVSLSEMARQLAVEVKWRPDVAYSTEGEPVFVSAETLLRWMRRYRKEGLAGLEKQPRSDRGRSRALDESLVARVLELSAERPAWTVKAIHRQLQRELGRAVPLKPVYRVLKGRKRVPPTDAFRKRPPGVPQNLWIADTMHGPEVYGPRRAKRKSYLIAILDDASRLVVGASFVLSDDTGALMPVLHEALLARGLPHRLLVDNGPNYRSRALRTACAHLGIHLVHAAPYRATSKARLERFFLTVRMQMLPRLPEAPKLEEVRTEWARFVAEYHETSHSALSEISGRPTTPLTYYLQNLPDDVEYREELDLNDFFQVEVVRRVNADGTIRLASRSWEVRPELAGRRVLVRYDPEKLRTIGPRAVQNGPIRVVYRVLEDRHAPFEVAFPVP